MGFSGNWSHLSGGRISGGSVTGVLVATGSREILRGFGRGDRWVVIVVETPPRSPCAAKESRDPSCYAGALYLLYFICFSLSIICVFLIYVLSLSLFCCNFRFIPKTWGYH